MSESSTGFFVTLDPTSGPPEARDHPRIGRALPSLAGVTVGLLSNGKANGTELLDAVYEALAEQYPLAGSIAIRKESVSVPPRPEDFDRLTREAGAVITAVGD